MSDETNETIPAPAAFRMVGNMAPLFAAVAEATAKFEPIQKDRHVKIQTRDRGTYEFDYATLEEVLRCTTPALAASGLKLWHFLCDGVGEGDREIHHILSHASGAFLETVQTLPRTDRWQEFGSAITYARRYQVQCILGVSAEFDDDGNEADGNKVEAVRDRSKAPTPKAQPKPAPKPEPKAEPEVRTQPKSDRPPPPVPSEAFDDSDEPCPEHISKEIGMIFRRLKMQPTETVVMCREVTGKAPKELTLGDGEKLLAHVRKLEEAEKEAQAALPGNVG